MARLTSARNNCGICAETLYFGATAAQSLSIAVMALLAHLATAMPLPPNNPSGCCVRYSFTYDHEECCHEFSDVSGPTECNTEPGWVGGGRRFHAEQNCEDVQELQIYTFQDPEAPSENFRGEENYHADAAGCCVSFGLSGTSECCHEFTSISSPEECVLPPDYVGGGRRFHSSSCEVTQNMVQYTSVEPYEELVLDTTGRTEPVVVADLPDGVSNYRNEDPEIPAETISNTESAVTVGGSQSLGPEWTRDDSIEPPAGEQTIDGYVVAVYTPEQQARLGIGVNGEERSDDADEVSTDLTGQKPIISRDDDQQAADPVQYASIPGVLPVMVDPEAMLDEAGTDGPCPSLPATSMVIAPWIPQCDDNNQYLPLQCDRTGDCWCVDAVGERINLSFTKYTGTSVEACMAAREMAVQEPSEAAPTEHEVLKENVGVQPIIATPAAQSSDTAVETIQQYGAETEQHGAAPAVPDTAGDDTAVGNGVAVFHSIDKPTHLISWIAGGAAALVAFSALILHSAKRDRTSSELRAGFSATTMEGTGSACSQSTQPPNWSKSWIVSGIGLGDSLAAPVEPDAPPPGLNHMDRVSLVGMPRLPSTLQFSTNDR